MAKKYIDAEKVIAEVERLCAEHTTRWETDEVALVLDKFEDFIISLQQEQQMPDSTQLITEWEKEKAVLEQKDFRGDAERMAYNAFLDGFIKGLGYEGTK